MSVCCPDRTVLMYCYCTDRAVLVCCTDRAVLVCCTDTVTGLYWCVVLTGGCSTDMSVLY